MRSCMTIDTRDRRGKTHKAGDFAVPQGPSERTEVAAIDMDGLAAPSDEPPVLSVIPVPGEICTPRRMSEDKSSGAVTVNKKSSTVRSVQSEQDKPKCLTLHSGQRGLPKRHVFTMEEVEAQTHTALLARSQPELDISGSFTQKQGAASSVSIVDPVAEESASLSSESRNSDNEAEVVLGSNEQLDPNKSSQQILRSSLSRYPPEGGKKVLQMCRRMSLDDLRLNHDAVIATTQRTETNTRGALTGESLISSSSSFCRCAKLWLAVVGIMNFPDLRPGCALFCMSVVLLVLVGALVSLTSMGLSDPYISATTLCYLVGVLAAAWRLRWSGVEDLLVRADGLEDYAKKSGFLEEWRRTSQRRLKEVMGFLVVMLCCRWLADASNRIWDLQTRERPEIAACFSVSAIIFSAIMYIQLHIVAGLEHAIDSFSINFYSDMDIEVALGEWNMVQATLRQVSTKLSATMLLLGSSCGASLLLLVQLTVLHDDSQPGLKSGLPFLCFTSWLFPPVLLFLYSMMRAAGVTEKASRVAPLVNSWNFEHDEDDNVPSWMDLGRQYIVQYMIQSEAGFYLQGMRLHAFQVTKLSYYFAAFIFALFSRSWA